MKAILIFVAAIILIACSKEHSYSGKCGNVTLKIHDTSEPTRNDIWLLAVCFDGYSQLIGIDSTSYSKINIGDRYCK